MFTPHPLQLSRRKETSTTTLSWFFFLWMSFVWIVKSAISIVSTLPYVKSQPKCKSNSQVGTCIKSGEIPYLSWYELWLDNKTIEDCNTNSTPAPNNNRSYRSGRVTPVKCSYPITLLALYSRKTLCALKKFSKTLVVELLLFYYPLKLQPYGYRGIHDPYISNTVA